jgi:hypothetical protein
MVSSEEIYRITRTCTCFRRSALHFRIKISWKGLTDFEGSNMDNEPLRHRRVSHTDLGVTCSVADRLRHIAIEPKSIQ